MTTIILAITALLVVASLTLVHVRRRKVLLFTQELVPRLEAEGWEVTETFWKAPGSEVMVIKAGLPNGTTTVMEVKGA